MTYPEHAGKQPLIHRVCSFFTEGAKRLPRAPAGKHIIASAGADKIICRRTCPAVFYNIKTDFLRRKTDPVYEQLHQTSRAHIYQYDDPGTQLLESDFADLLNVLGKTVSQSVVTGGATL